MKKFILTACAVLLSISLIYAQESKGEKNEKKKQEKLHVKLKDGATPDIYVDGKKFNFRLELLDKDMIESINVIKGEKAIKEYNAPNGVVLVQTKKKDDSANKEIIKDSTKIKENPLVIIDGKEYDNQDVLKKLKPEEIENIAVLKDKAASKMYNSPSGVIIITTKKGKKKANGQ